MTWWRGGRVGGKWQKLAADSAHPLEVTCETRRAGPQSVSVKHMWKNVAPWRTENSTIIFWVRAGLFVGCRESLQSLWGELL
jgi:hypothetical protein